MESRGMATAAKAKKRAGRGPRVVMVGRNHPRANLAEQDHAGFQNARRRNQHFLRLINQNREPPRVPSKPRQGTA